MKNIIITGASSGIGYQTALHLAKMGGNHIFAIARSSERLLELSEECKKFTNSKLSFFVFDISNPKIDDLIKSIEKELVVNENQKIDILINNAGFLVNKSFVDTMDQDWNQTFETNLFAPARLIRKLIPLFEKKVGSHIINIGSMGGIQGTEKFSGLAAYSTSKGALNILTECLAMELKEFNISVNAINPGSVQTEMLGIAFPGYIASVNALEMGEYVAHFALHNQKLMNGRLVEVSLRN